MRNGRKLILEILDQIDIWLTPSNIAYNTDLSQGYVRRQCKQLYEQYGLLMRDADGTKPFYRTTERGKLALQHNSLDVEYKYHGKYDPDANDQWRVVVEPSNRLLRSYGEKYHGQGRISWGKAGGDGGSYKLAQNLLRHAVGDEAADKFAMEYHKKVTRRLGGSHGSFTLSESVIEHWVRKQQESSTESKSMAPTSTSNNPQNQTEADNNNLNTF